MLDLSHRHELEWLAQLLDDVRSAVQRLEPLPVGAMARDLLLHYGHGLKIERATGDVDFALAVADWAEFSRPGMHCWRAACSSLTRGQRTNFSMRSTAGWT